MNPVAHNAEEYQANKLAAALEFQWGARALIGDRQRVFQIIEQVLDESPESAPSRAIWEHAIRTHCEIDEQRKRRWPDHRELNVLLFQLLHVTCVNVNPM